MCAPGALGLRGGAGLGWTAMRSGEAAAAPPALSLQHRVLGDTVCPRPGGEPRGSSAVQTSLRGALHSRGPATGAPATLQQGGGSTGRRSGMTKGPGPRVWGEGLAVFKPPVLGLQFSW